MVNRHHFIHALVSLAWLAVVPATTIQAQSSESERTVFFESKIRPLLAERCWKCHSGTKQSGQLRLDSLQHVIDGGESGPAVVPGDVDGSLLLQAVRYQSLEMPPDQKLSDDEIQRLQQ